jgi:hypothetical protein
MLPCFSLRERTGYGLENSLNETNVGCASSSDSAIGNLGTGPSMEAGCSCSLSDRLERTGQDLCSGDSNPTYAAVRVITI